MVAPAFAADDELSTNGGWVRWAGFGDGGLEYESAGREEFADGRCDGLAFAFGLPRVLEAKVVPVGGCKEVGDVCDAVTEGAAYIECTCVEVREKVAGHGVYVEVGLVVVKLLPSGVLAWRRGVEWVRSETSSVGWRGRRRGAWASRC